MTLAREALRLARIIYPVAPGTARRLVLWAGARTGRELARGMNRLNASAVECGRAMARFAQAAAAHDRTEQG